MNSKTRMIVFAVLGLILFAGAIYGVAMTAPASSALASDTTVYDNNSIDENFKFLKNIGIWFMLMLVAFLMMFIRKFEWSVLLATLLSAATSFVGYLAIQQFIFGEAWNQTLMIAGVVCAITLVIAIGVFLGTIKMWQYPILGLLFAPVYVLMELFMGGSIFGLGYATDPGGSILVHMGAAYFGLGVALAIREKKAFGEPMYTTTHSVGFVWLAAMLLWMLWPTFVTAFLPPEQVFWGIMTCYMAGVGSIIAAYVVCQVVEKKVNPLVYAYAMLAGPVAIGAPLLIVGAWGALVVGILAGALSALSFLFIHPWLCKKLGVLDVMGVHNLHGIPGWLGGIIAAVVVGSFVNIVAAFVIMFGTIIAGLIIGTILKLSRGVMPEGEAFMNDDNDFIKSEKPADA
ncbi:MAG: ammonium transporter [Methanosarcinales archaeon]|jgi:ammonium transporter Rh|nr:ammonium transporter [Methanosarcinales archaeon]